MGEVVVDACLVIGVFDRQDAHHEIAVEAVRSAHLAGDTFVLPASVLSEVLVGEARNGHDAVEVRKEQITRLFGPARPIDGQVATQAAHLRATHPSLRLPDALVLAVCVVNEAKAVLTTDKRLAGVDERVRLVSA